jgi:hypothetical protein
VFFVILGVKVQKCKKMLSSHQCCGSGSGIRDPVLFYPPDPGSGSGIRDGAVVGSGSGISKQNFLIACVKKEVGSGIRCFFTPRIRDPGSGSGMEQWSDPDPGSGIKHPGSATLAHMLDLNPEPWFKGIVSRDGLSTETIGV